MWGGLLIEYHTTQVTVALGWVLIGRLTVSLKNRRHSRRSTAIGTWYMHACLQREHCVCLSKRGVVTYYYSLRILFPAILLINCVLYNNSQFAINKICRDNHVHYTSLRLLFSIIMCLLTVHVIHWCYP